MLPLWLNFRSSLGSSVHLRPEVSAPARPHHNLLLHQHFSDQSSATHTRYMKLSLHYNDMVPGSSISNIYTMLQLHYDSSINVFMFQLLVGINSLQPKEWKKTTKKRKEMKEKLKSENKNKNKKMHVATTV